MNPVFLSRHEYDAGTAEAKRLGYDSLEKFLGVDHIPITENIPPTPKETITLTGRAAQRARAKK